MYKEGRHPGHGHRLCSLTPRDRGFIEEETLHATSVFSALSPTPGGPCRDQRDGDLLEPREVLDLGGPSMRPPSSQEGGADPSLSALGAGPDPSSGRAL